MRFLWKIPGNRFRFLPLLRKTGLISWQLAVDSWQKRKRRREDSEKIQSQTQTTQPGQPADSNRKGMAAGYVQKSVAIKGAAFRFDPVQAETQKNTEKRRTPGSHGHCLQSHHALQPQLQGMLCPVLPQGKRTIIRNH